MTSEISLHLSGMTCSACSNTIEKALQSVEGVSQCSVSLMSEIAQITYDSAIVTPSDLVNEVEDVGFEAEIAGGGFEEEQKSSQVELSVMEQANSNVKKAFMSISGMTCSACSSTIEKSLSSCDGVISVKVSLITETAEVLYDPKVLQEAQIVEEVEDVGFEADIIQQRQEGSNRLILQLSNIPVSLETSLKQAALVVQGVRGIRFLPASVDSALKVEVVFDSSCPGPRSIAEALCSALVSRGSKAKLISGKEKNSELNSLTDAGVVVVKVLDGGSGDIEARKRDMAARRERELNKYRRAFYIALAFTIPSFFVAMICPLIPFLHEVMSHKLFHHLTIDHLVLWILCTPVQFGVGKRFFVHGYKSLRHGAATMDVLVALGSISAYLYSIVSVAMCILNEKYMGRVFFESSAMLITIVVGGKYVENVAKGRTSEAVTSLMSLQPATATVLTLEESAAAALAQVERNEAGNVPENEEVDSTLVQKGTRAVVRPERSEFLILTNFIEQIIDSKLLQSGDILQVKMFSKFPCDGLLVRGLTNVDEALVTGESMPVRKGKGDQVIGSTLNVGSVVWMRATGVGENTMLSKIVKLINDAQTNKAPVQAFADRIAGKFVPGVLFLALLTFVAWYTLLKLGIVPPEWKTEGTNDFLFSFLFAVAVTVISCPCSLGLATPTAVMVGTGVGAKHGVLFKGGEPLETTGKCQYVLFDKTGTLTEGKPVVNMGATHLMPSVAGLKSERELWAMVHGVESLSEHLLGKVISVFAKQQCTQATMSGMRTTGFLSTNGLGVRAEVNGRTVSVGSAAWLSKSGAKLSDEWHARARACQDKGEVVVFVGVQGANSESHFCVGMIVMADQLKPEAIFTVKKLREMGIQVCMVTGDNARTARAMAKRLGIPANNIHAQVTPEDKALVVKQIQFDDNMEENSDENLLGSGRGQISDSTDSSGAVSEDARQRRVVLFVGDGVNDSPALAQADVGVAIGAGTDIAVETASVVLMKEDLTTVITAIDLSRKTVMRIHANFKWAIVYNILAIPIAAGVLYPWVRVTLPPMVAAAAMGCSSVSVVLSSLALKRYQPPSNSGFHSIALD